MGPRYDRINRKREFGSNFAEEEIRLARLKDIAERVGVSISTVSRAISNDTSRPVSEDTKQRIREAALELGYKLQEPMQTARDNGTEIKRIVCIVPQLLMDDHPYFSKVLAGFHEKWRSSDSLRPSFAPARRLAMQNGCG